MADDTRQTMRIESASATNRGLVRDTNDDAVGRYPRLGLFAVADGVGTERRGDVAARMALECLKERFSHPSTRWPAPGLAPRGQELEWSLRLAIEECHRRILRDPQRITPAGRMATTVAALAFRRGQTVVAHVGDSRVYRLRSGQLSRLTRDHSFVQDQIDKGKMDPAEAMSSPMANVIMRALGFEERFAVETQAVDIQPGDVALLCTDGLSGEVSDADLGAVLNSGAPARRMVETLIDAALQSGGGDNVSCVVVRRRA